MQRAISQDDDAQGLLASVLAKQEIVRAQQIGHGVCQPWDSPAWCAADHAVVQVTRATRSLKVTGNHLFYPLCPKNNYISQPPTPTTLHPGV